MESAPVQSGGPVRSHRAHWLVLITSLALTCATTFVVYSSIRERDEGRFRNAMQAADDRIVARINVYIASLRGGVALFAASDSVTEAAFRRYVERLDIHGSFPGIQGIGFSQRIARSTTGEPDEIHAIRFLEPQDERNRAALDYDMYAEAERRGAMRRSRDTAQPALSGPVRLVQEIDDEPQPGFLIYVPVYAGGGIPPTEAERREALIGHVYGAFRAQDLFEGIFGSEQFPRVSFSVYDGDTIAASTMLHSSARAGDHSPAHVGVSRLGIAGRDWTVVYESQPMFELGSGRSWIPVGFIIGLIFSAWLFWLSRRLSQQRRKAEEASLAKSAFLANMSHELRTPLNAIGGYVDLMQLGIPDPVTQAQQNYLARIQHAKTHLLTLINDVLNFAKLEAGRVEFRRGPASVPEVVGDALSMLMPAGEMAGVRLESTGGPDACVTGDTEKIRQVLLNLLTNAIKFTERGGSVDIAWEVDPQHVHVHVIDTGIGIHPDDQERIFDAFVQADDDLTRERQGTGLGLSISRALVQGMNGEITLRSKPGEGSTFTVTLPRITAEPAVDRSSVEVP